MPTLTFNQALEIGGPTLTQWLNENITNHAPPPPQTPPIPQVMVGQGHIAQAVANAQMANQAVWDDIMAEPVPQEQDVDPMAGATVTYNPWTTVNIPDMATLQPTAGLTIKRPKKSPSLDEKGMFVSKRMGDVYSYRQLSVNKSACTAFEKSYVPDYKPFKWSHEDGLVGIEIEVENIRTPAVLSPHWTAKDDGSLRNHGMEYVSVPLQVKQIQPALSALYASLKLQNQPDFSNRTSTHIHLNCRDLTQDQVWVMVMLYAIFEKHFYGFAGAKRLNSIFCVPLYRCNILNNINDVVYAFSPNWHKYSGLNILPLIDNNSVRGYGTIEFRHLYGTADQTLILEWIDQILCLRKACLEIKKEDLIEQIKTMNTTSDYLALFYRVFTSPARVKDKQVFEECISNIKRELFQRDYLTKLKINSEGEYWKHVHKMGMRG